MIPVVDLEKGESKGGKGNESVSTTTDLHLNLTKIYVIFFENLPWWIK